MDGVNLIDFSKETKKQGTKKKKDQKEADINLKDFDAETKKQAADQLLQSQQKVDYDKLYISSLERITRILRQNNPSLAQQTSLQLEKPQLEKQGTKKIIWKNFEFTCKQMNRDPNHVYQYFLIELGTEGYLANEQLLIKGKYTNQNIESLIKKYLLEFVMCQHCKSSNTILTKDTEARLHTKECKNCKATMSVSTLKLQKKKEK